MSEELVVVKEVDIPALFQDKGCDPIIEGLKKEAAKFKGDVTTAKGRKEIASFARKFSTAKTYLDGLGKALSDEYRAKIEPINGERNKIKTCCDELRDETRKPLTDWEDAEKGRVAKHEQNIATINDYLNVEVDDSTKAKELLDAVKEFVIDDSFEEFELAATKAKASVLTQLEAKFIVLQNAEKEKAEAERLEAERLEKERIEREEQIAKEAAEKAKKEAEEKARIEAEEKEGREKAEKERLEKEKLQAELDKKKAEDEKREAEEKAEREKKEAAEKAEKEKQEAVEAEKKRQEEEIEADRKDDADRQANKRHRNKIFKETKESLRLWCVASVKFVPQSEELDLLVEAMVEGRIRNVEVKF